MQSKQELESWYHQPDPWGYESNPEDDHRKRRILAALEPYVPFTRALDIGCGEGFITRSLPAVEIHGIEVSDKAAERLNPRVHRVHVPRLTYDLVLATGVLYEHYDWRQFTDWIMEAASRIVLTSHIKSWEVNELPKEKQVHEEEFSYRDFVQKLRVYKW